MDIPDAVIGKLVLVTTSAVFVVLCLWVNSYPFIDDGEYQHYHVTTEYYILCDGVVSECVMFQSRGCTAWSRTRSGCWWRAWRGASCSWGDSCSSLCTIYIRISETYTPTWGSTAATGSS